MLLRHCGTKRSVAAQTADSVEHEDSLLGLAHDLRDDDGGLPDVSPQKRCSSGAPSNKKLGGTPETSAPHSADSGPDSRPKLAVTIAHSDSYP